MPELIKAYFSQDVQYFSESRETLRLIATMNPKYAANAADKLLRQASFWADEAGVITPHPALWVATSPLFRALTERADA